MKLIVGISGASGVEIGVEFIKHIPKDIELFVVNSDNSHTVYDKENRKTFAAYDNTNIAAPIASGSFGADAMIIVPCSTNTLSKIAHGISDNLITRASSVMLKERKQLILALRETPLSTIMLKNMTKLSKYGAIIAPPMLGYYSEQKSLEDMHKFLFGKWLDLLGIENRLYKRWNG